MKKLLLTLVGVLFVFPVFAADYSSIMAEAKGGFDRRGENVSFAQACAAGAAQALTLAQDDEQKFDALILESRCTYYVGMKNGSDEEKKTLFGHGKDVAAQARDLMKDRAEGYYFFGINLARWAEANGILKSLGERHNLRRSMENALTRSARVEGRAIPGREFEQWGANRTLGRMYFKLPSMFGGDNEKAERLLREAVEKTPSTDLNALNVYYLAEVLVANGKRQEARTILDEVLKFERAPEKYNPTRVPETIDEMKMAASLRKELGN